MTQPIEHYTLEQVADKASWQGLYFDNPSIELEALHALLNDAINELIGEPVAWVTEPTAAHFNLPADSDGSGVFRYSACYGANIPLYTPKEPKP